ncbi:CocE/NonD family hydrolase [Nocardia sp. NBC_01377]|uniref:CocE/NonD family hydrolase n=1 Tax=Nocardia sp. NBC_01377 TaxID=2903595 RepID=UPI003250DBE6
MFIEWDVPAAARPPALKALFPVVPGSDLVNDVLAPGGGFGFNFIPLWLTAINTLKWVPDVQSIVDGQFDYQWLADRGASPLTFMDVFLNAYTATRFQDADPRLAEHLTDTSPSRREYLSDPSRIEVSTFVVGGWHDLFTYSESKIYCPC